MTRLSLTPSLTLATAVAVSSTFFACQAAVSDDDNTVGDGDGTPGGDGDINPGTGAGPGDGDIVVDDPIQSGDGDGDGPRDIECDIDPVTGEEVCTCISIATWGALGSFGAVPGADGQDAIVAWLNANSTGDAEYFATKPAITAEFLAGYDVIILQNLFGWAFTPEETATVQAWVEAGGGIISLAGYDVAASDGFNETNQLLAFSGMQYVGTTGAGDISGAAFPGCGYCLGNSDIQGGFDPNHPISANVTAVGAFWGRSIDPGATGAVVATHQGLVAAAAADIGEGRVFMFHDEWVTYNSQWDGSGLQNDCTLDPNHSCAEYHPTLTFQIPQFWYNSILWTSGDIECFVVEGVVVR